jgi:hypothetical protein
MRALLTAFLMLSLTEAAAAGGWTKDNGDFSVDLTYRQVEDGRPSASVFMLGLVCIDNRCKLEIVSLNQCFEQIGQRPRSQTSFNMVTPWYGQPTLTVTRSANVILATDRFPGGALSYRLVISPDASVTSQTGDLHGIGSISFSGSLDKYSDILKRQIAVPLVRVPPGMISAACPFSIE